MENNLNRVTGQILGLQALRAFAFLGIFICHTQILHKSLSFLGAWGVEVFFMLSGFLMVYNYLNKQRIKKSSFISNIKFAYSRIKKIYLLHILCTLAMIVFFFVGDDTEEILNVVYRFILNLLLVQEYFIDHDGSINGVAWFLCPLLFGYFIFPFLIKRFETKYSITKAGISIVLSVLVMFAIILLNLMIFRGNIEAENQNNLIISIWYWLIKNAHLFCLIYIYIGFNLGYIFVNMNKKISGIKMNIIEVIAILLTFSVFYYLYVDYLNKDTEPLGVEIVKKLSLQLFFVLQCILLIYTFAIQKGFISNLLVNKVTLFIAKISPEAFLIHCVVLRYFDAAYCHYYKIDFALSFDDTLGPYLCLTVGLLITVFCSYIYKLIYQRYLMTKGL